MAPKKTKEGKQGGGEEEAEILQSVLLCDSYENSFAPLTLVFFFLTFTFL